MPPRIPDEARRAILDDIDSRMPRNQIAAKHHVSPSTVTGIARQNNRSFDRSQTKNATEAARADNAALRAQITGELYRSALEWIGQTKRPFLAFSFGGKDNTYNEHLLDHAPTGDIRNLMTSVGIAVQRAAELERFDAEQGVESARSVVAQIAEGFGLDVDRHGP